MKLTKVPELLKLVQGTKLAQEINFLLDVLEDSIPIVVEEIFLKTPVVVSGSIPQEGVKISELIKRFKEVAKKRGITDITIDSDIIDFFGDYLATISLEKPSRLVRFLKTITQNTTAKASKQLNAYDEYDLGDAISRTTALVDAGEFDEVESAKVVIYLQNRKDNVSYRLSVWRDIGVLYLDVSEVILRDKDREGDGVLVSNYLED